MLRNGEPAQPAVFATEAPIRGVIGLRIVGQDGSQRQVVGVGPPPPNVANEFLTIWTVEPYD